jgi:hypothetical protein
MGFSRYAAGAVALLAALSAFLSGSQTHDEAALLTNWSTPPPWPVFIGINGDVLKYSPLVSQPRHVLLAPEHQNDVESKNVCVDCML